MPTAGEAPDLRPWRIVQHAYLLTLHSLPLIARLFWLPFLVSVAVGIIRLGYGAEPGGARNSGPGDWLTSIALLMLYIPGMVAWHRWILIGDAQISLSFSGVNYIIP